MNVTFSLIIIFLLSGVVGGYLLFQFLESSPAEKADMVRNWLLYAVAVAEYQLGPKTGKLKLAQVYNKFVTECPTLARAITYEKFSQLVDEVLINFKEILSNNNTIEALISGKEQKN